MDLQEIGNILLSGDLHGVNKIQYWVDTAITNGTWNNER